MSDLQGKKVLVGVTGGIAAYKSALLVRLLVSAGAEVRVIMTAMAAQFITPLTMATLSQRPVVSEFYDTSTGQWNSHVEMGRWADLFVIAPATANTMAKIVTGLADNILTATCLAARCPIMISPTMDLDMYRQSSTQANLKVLRERGILVVEPNTGFLASGLHGKGRMAEPEQILEAIKHTLLGSSTAAQGRFVLVTSGPTRESIDPVRFISNRSSGRMGKAISEALVAKGFTVHCVTGPCEYVPEENARLKVYPVETAQQMHDQCIALWPKMDAGVLAAAVADYRPAEPKDQKIRHTSDSLDITLESCPDIAYQLGALKSPIQRLVGFALETDNGVNSAKRKLERKNLDICILNTLADPGAGFCSATNKTTFYFADGRSVPRPLESKESLSTYIAECLAEMFEKHN